MADNIFKTINIFRRNIPVDVHGLACALNVDVKEVNLDKEISGEISKNSKGYTIRVNENHPVTRKRFTIAHELGHFAFHKTLIGDGIFEDKMYRSTNYMGVHNISIGNSEEREANQFAVNLLMPSEMIKEYYLKYESQGLILDSIIDQMAEDFKVSRQSMAIKVNSITKYLN